MLVITIFGIGLIICMLGLIISVRMLFRNDRVFSFRVFLLKLSHDYTIRHPSDLSVYKWFIDKYSYKDMLWSFKKLRLEDWYTEEEIYKIYH